MRALLHGGRRVVAMLQASGVQAAAAPGHAGADAVVVLEPRPEQQQDGVQGPAAEDEQAQGKAGEEGDALRRIMPQ